MGMWGRRSVESILQNERYPLGGRDAALSGVAQPVVHDTLRER
jgi:hypothetical protein